MKRNTIRLIALILALMLALCACGGQDTVSGTVTPAATEAPEKEMSLGRIEGGSYTNDYVGFTMELGGDWVFYSAEELQDIPENVAEMFKDSELGEQINPLDQFTDMMAESVEELATINVLCQKLDMQTRLAYAALDEEAILNLVLGQSDQMMEAYAAAGIAVEKMETVKVTFLGQERTALKTYGSVQGVAYYTLQVFEYHLGKYSVTITFASYIDDKTDSLVALCNPIA